QASRQQRAETEQLAALGSLAAGLAHELATPLASIQLLGEELGEGAPGEPISEALHQQVQRCHELLEHLRRGSHAGESTPGLGEQLAVWVSEWQGAHRVPVRLSVAPGLRGWSARGEAARWRGVLWTLLDNALRAGSPDVEVRASLTR